MNQAVLVYILAVLEGHSHRRLLHRHYMILAKTRLRIERQSSPERVKADEYSCGLLQAGLRDGLPQPAAAAVTTGGT